MSQNEITSMIETLDAALLGKRPVPRLTLTNPDLSLSEAYEIQHGLISKRVTRGEKVLGYKMGLTSRAKIEQMGIDSPIFGVLTDQMVVDHGSQIDLNHWIHPKIEPEIAFLITKDLKWPVTSEDILNACGGVAPALEILDSRFEGFKYFSLPDVVADNSSSSAFVLGPRWTLPDDLNLKNLEIKLFINNQEVAVAKSDAVLGDPVLSVVELCKLLAQQSLELKAGQVVLTGAATAAFKLEPNQTIHATVQSLGDVRLSNVRKT